jgi:hypothetical protein
MKLAHTNLSKLKACRKLAGGKAGGRHPRAASHFVTALKGRRNLVFTVSSALQGAEIYWTFSWGIAPLKPRLISGNPSGCCKRRRGAEENKIFPS